MPEATEQKKGKATPRMESLPPGPGFSPDTPLSPGTGWGGQVRKQVCRRQGHACLSSTMGEIPKVPWDGSGLAKPTVLLRDPPPDAAFSSSSPASPNNKPKWGPLPSCKPCSPWLRRDPFCHVRPPLSRRPRGLGGDTLTWRRLKVPVLGLHLTNGSP